MHWVQVLGCKVLRAPDFLASCFAALFRLGPPGARLSVFQGLDLAYCVWRCIRIQLARYIVFVWPGDAGLQALCKDHQIIQNV